MMSMLWVVIFVAIAGTHSGYGLPVRPTPQDYPHDGYASSEVWGVQGGMFAAISALALLAVAVAFVAGCTWCFRHKDCKPNEGTDNQLFTSSASPLHAAQRVLPPDSGFSEPANNNISEDNNNGPISLREMQNIANNNAAAYIVSENEERNRYSRELIVEFEPLPAPFIQHDPLERCADWFGDEDFPRSNLQYLRELERGWFGRVVVGEIEDSGRNRNVAVKILNQNATLEDKARFLDECRLYRDSGHENILAFVGKCLQEDPWILIFELCTVDLQQYLVANRPSMAVLNESGVPLRLMCDVTAALAYLHSQGITYGALHGGSVQTRGAGAAARALLGRYVASDPPPDCLPPELRRGDVHNTSSEMWSLGSLVWAVCAWGAPPAPPAPPPLPCPYKDHLYQVMQLCWHSDPSERPTAAQAHALISHLHATLTTPAAPPSDHYPSPDFEERWQRLKPNSIPKLDEHVAIIHAPSTSTSASTYRYISDRDSDHNALGIDMDVVVSRSSSIMSDRDPLSVLKSESLTNLHGSLEDVRNIYLTHNETPTLECHQGNILEDVREREQDRSDSSVDPWLKDIIAGSQDDVSYYRDVSDVIKNLDNILNSEKTSSSESSHQASPSRDNLNLDCKRELPSQSSLVKSPGITNFQNILDTGFGGKARDETCEEEEDRDTIGSLSHSFERHSDSTSQHTLENITPDTPMKDFSVVVDSEQLEDSEAAKGENQTKAVEDFLVETDKSVEYCTELPKVEDSNVPKLKELCLASITSVSESNELSLVRKDCQTSCDNVTEIRTDNEEPKSIDDVRDTFADSKPLEGKEVTDSVLNEQIEKKSLDEIILPISADETIISVEGMDTLPSLTDDVSTATQDNTSNIKLESNQDDIEPYSIESENNYSKDETILVSDLVDTITDSLKDELKEELKEPETLLKVDIKEVELESVSKQMPVSVQNIIDVKIEPADMKPMEKADSDEEHVEIMPTHLPPEIVQNTDNDAPVPEAEVLVHKEIVGTQNDNVDNKESESKIANRSDSYVVIGLNDQSVDSTVYMDLINDTNSQILNFSPVNDSVKEEESNSAFEVVPSHVSDQESTQYLDLPSFEVIKNTNDFLHMERVINSIQADNIVASTPITSDNSADILENTVENSIKEETLILSETKVPEQRNVPETASPFDSPSHKSLHTDTYDENSSVVLGPFENCTEYRSSKINIDPVELPKEELLAFSSNFSEMNLATPSPLRDGNFLNEVPDILPDDSQLEDLASISEPKLLCEVSDDSQASGSGTQKHVSPSTPPNSPGIFLASTSQQKYLVDIDLNAEPEVASVVDMNQIELQITSKLAMAENENNLNIEYSGPLTVEGLIEEGGAMRDSDAIPESYLAGNGGSVEDIREELSLDEECVKALRNELELKLPLAQVAAIEPQCEGEGEWQAELPPPPELVVNYPGALSPIVEETGQQLSAYENDINWNPSTRTDSSESYPEPCNLSDSEGVTGHTPRTYTLPPDTKCSHVDVTMSADSLNASPRKSNIETTPSPIDDRTYVKDDNKNESNCERISQVSPFLVSPTTDTSDNDNATRLSTVSKTTLPTDAKHSKPESQCLSKATSIDSWCSNDTLYNVEENFDDLAMDPDPPLTYEPDEHSDSTDTLHNDDKEVSHCSTYIIHDSKSEPCDTFSPDSITGNENNTYTKVKTELLTPPDHAKSDPNDSTKNTQTKDLAYGTLVSGMTPLSNCTTEAASGFEDVWKLPQPELVRKSPIGNDFTLSPPTQMPDKECAEHSSPQLSPEPTMKRMDSVEISCLGNNLIDSPDKYETENHDALVSDIPNCDFKKMAPSLTSTPLCGNDDNTENVVPIPMTLPETTYDSSDNTNTLTFQNFQQSAEVRPQDLSTNTVNATNQESEVLLDGESKSLSRNSRNSLIVSERTPTYSDFENSAAWKPQDIYSVEKSSQSSEGFHNFENSVKNRPQDLSSLIDASFLFLRNERMSSELVDTAVSLTQDQPSQSNNEPMQSLDISPPSVTNLIESHEVVAAGEASGSLLINFNSEEETDQPHSIIVTEVPVNSSSASANRTHDFHADSAHTNFNNTYDSHESRSIFSQAKINGDIVEQPQSLIMIEEVFSLSEEPVERSQEKSAEQIPKDLPNGTTESPKSANVPKGIQLNGGSERYATVNFLSETFEELIESSVDDSDSKEDRLIIDEDVRTPEAEELEENVASPVENQSLQTSKDALPGSSSEVGNSTEGEVKSNGISEEDKITAATEDFLQNEKRFATYDSYLPILNDIRFTGPATEMMSTSFQESPTSPTSPECEQDSKGNTAAEIMKEWDSDSDSHSSNSSSGEFIWKDGAGHETAVVPTPHFDHQRNNGGPAGGAQDHGSGASEGSGDSGSGSEGDEVEFVPSSWDCRAAPSKSSLRSIEATPESKKRVVFKRQKYHCVYEYPREVEAGARSPALLPDLSTYCEWDPSSAEEAELCYGQLFAMSGARPAYTGIAFAADYDEDFFISSSARPFESLGLMSTASQFFPGMGLHKRALLERSLSDESSQPPSPPPVTTLDLTTPDSGVEDITPSSTIDEDFKREADVWRVESSSESASPSSPASESLGGLRHTRDRLKLDLPPSPHAASPKHGRVFNFTLEKPKRREPSTPLVMTDETPVLTPLPVQEDNPPAPEPTFSTFGKTAPKAEPEQKIILDEAEPEAESPKVVEGVKGEGTVLDSGDEDSGIESSSKATLERNTPNVS